MSTVNGGKKKARRRTASWCRPRSWLWRTKTRSWYAYNAELLRLHRKYRFPLVHFSPDGAFEEDFIAPLTAFARSLGLSGPLDRFFDDGLVHQTERGPAGTLRARFLFRRLVSRSRQTAGSGAPLAPPTSSQPSA